MLFEGFGFDYFGPLDGHNMDEMMETLENVSHIKGPVLLHVVTKKGKGIGKGRIGHTHPLKTVVRPDLKIGIRSRHSRIIKHPVKHKLGVERSLLGPEGKTTRQDEK